MTEIDERFLARGKRVDNGEWIEGYYGECYNGKENVSCIAIPSEESICGSLCYEIIKKTVNRYTGLRDMNGTRIYEGDIVEGEQTTYRTYSRGSIEKHNLELFEEIDDVFHFKGIVACDNGSFYVEDDIGNLPLNNFGTDEVEVIGNIHDNPELLEK